MLEEALRAQVQRVVYTSSVAAVGPARPGEIADEENVWEAGRYRIAYVDSKQAAEVAAVRLVPRGLPLVTVNPAHVLGAGDPGRSSTVLVRRFMRRQIPAYVDGTLNIVSVRGRGPRAPARGRARGGGRALHPRKPELHPPAAVRRSRPAVRSRSPPAVKLPLARRALAGARRPANRAVSGCRRRPRCARPRSTGRSPTARPSASWAGAPRRTRIAWRRRSPSTVSVTRAAWPRRHAPAGAAPAASARWPGGFPSLRR